MTHDCWFEICFGLSRTTSAADPGASRAELPGSGGAGSQREAAAPRLAHHRSVPSAAAVVLALPLQALMTPTAAPRQMRNMSRRMRRIASGLMPLFITLALLCMCNGLPIKALCFHLQVFFLKVSDVSLQGIEASGE